MNIISLLALSRTLEVAKGVFQTSGDNLHKGAQVAPVGATKGIHILVSILTSDDDRWVARAEQFQVAHDGFRGGASKRPISDPNSLLPRARTL